MIRISEASLLQKIQCIYLSGSTCAHRFQEGTHDCSNLPTLKVFFGSLTVLCRQLYCHYFICYFSFQLCSNDLLDGVEELIDGISLLPEPDKALPVQDAEPQQSSNHGEEEGEVRPLGNFAVFDGSTKETGIDKEIRCPNQLVVKECFVSCCAGNPPCCPMPFQCLIRRLLGY